MHYYPSHDPSEEWDSKVTQLGQAWIELRIPARLCWNDVLEGICMIQALDADVRLPEVHCEVDVWYDDESPREVEVEPTRWRDLEVSRGKRVDLPFKARMLGGCYGQGGRVALLARGNNFWNVAWLEIRFSLQPPARVHAFVQAVSQHSGLRQVIWSQPHEPGVDAVVQLRGRSREHPELLKVDLKLHEAAGWLRGWMEVTGRMEGSNRGAPKVAVDGFEIAIPDDDLTEQLESVAEHFRIFFRQSRDLPIPVDAPAPQPNGKLPIPADPGERRVHQLPAPGDIEPG